ncbi:MAG: hypothetical protein KDB22_07105 [Planctomycetales bacterium]|nr:hypothetical protein [Planctomycetales bacterium]
MARTRALFSESPSKLRKYLIMAAVCVPLAFATAWWLQPGPQATTSGLTNVYFLPAETYMAGEVDFLRDESGNARIDSILLPELPQQNVATSDFLSAGYLGAQTCAECHQEYFDSFVKTSHFKTSAEPSDQSILGAFDDAHRVLTTVSENLRFEMLDGDGEFWQRLLYDDGQQTHGVEFQFGLVTGSGKVGQTYLYWQESLLYQMHVSYLSVTDSWTNSPGYRDGTADFARPIPALCLDCHATYFEEVAGNINQFQRDNYVLGVTCEKCHGPGREHVAYHRDHPQEMTAHGIVNPAELPTERAIEVCQVCHGGTPVAMLQPAFSFRPGDRLDHFFTFSENMQATGVHSNSQLPRLRQSKCFQQSPDMTCTTCHAPHEFERGDLQLFSQRCQNCHDLPDCGKFGELGNTIADNCIDCHMPSRELEDIKISSQGADHAPLMRDHFIKVWPSTTAH